MFPKPFVRYFPIDASLRESPLFLTGAGRMVIPPGADYPTRGHPELYQFDWREGRVLPEYSLLWVESGAGMWETRRGKFPLLAGQVGQIFSGEWHRYRPDPRKGWTECWVQFNGRLVHEWEVGSIFNPSCPVKRPEPPERFARTLREFLHDVASPDFTNGAVMGLRLAGLLGLVEEGGMDGEESRPTLVERARRYVWSHSHRQLDVVDVARFLGVHRRTLERAFSREGGGSVLDEISRCRLNRAERLLRETRLPVKQIIRLAGFGTAEQMRLHFLARHQCSPRDYRRASLG